MLELLMPFAASVVVTLLLRRLDRNNAHVNKIRKVVERGQKEMNELTRAKREELLDATTQFDLILVNADKYLDAMRRQLEETKSSLTNVEDRRNNLMQMDKDLQSLEDTTRNVKDQVRFINESLDKIDSQQKKLKKLQEHVNHIDSEAARLVDAFQGALRERSEEIIQNLEKKLIEIGTEVAVFQDDLKKEASVRSKALSEQIRADYEELEQQLKDSAHHMSADIEAKFGHQISVLNDLQRRIDQCEDSLSLAIPEKIRDIKDDLVEDLKKQQKLIEEMGGQITNIENGMRKRALELTEDMSKQKEMLYHELKNEADSLRSEIKNLDFETLAKRDEIIRAARDESLKVKSAIDGFHTIYEDASAKLYKEAETREKWLMGRLNEIQKESEAIVKSAESKVASLEVRFEDLNNHLESEFQSWLERIRKAAGDLELEFEKEISDKHLSLSSQISGLESDLQQVREYSTQETERKAAMISEKLASFEKSLLESQSQLINAWESESKSVLIKLQEREDSIQKLSETWQTRLSNLVHDADKNLHQTNLTLEKARGALIADMEQAGRDLMEEQESHLSDTINAFKERIEDREAALVGKLDSSINRFQEMRKQLEQKQDSLVDTLRSTRKEIEGMIKNSADEQLNLFQVDSQKVLEVLTSKIKDVASSTLSELTDSTSRILDEFATMQNDSEGSMQELKERHEEVMSAIIQETRNTGKEIRELQDALKELRSESINLEKTRATIEHIRGIINDLEGKLSHFSEKDQSVKELYGKIEDLKELRIKLDAELQAMSQKRQKVDKLEDQLQMILNLREQIEEKDNDLQKINLNISEIMQKYSDAETEKEKLEVMIQDFVEQRHRVEKTIDSIGTQEQGIEKLQTDIEKLANLIQKMDSKGNNLRTQIEKIENQMLGLDKRESEIRAIQDRFLQIEDLIEDIDRRKIQLDDLRKQYESLRKNIFSDVQTIEKIEADAESTVQRLADFLSAMDGQLPTQPLSKTMSAAVVDKKDMVIRLHRMGWSSREIADKLSFEVAAVDTILSTMNQNSRGVATS